MKYFLTLILLILGYNFLDAQNIFEEYQKEIDSVKVSDELYLSFFEKGYTLIKPEHEENIKGVLVSFEDRRYNLSPKDKKALIHPHANRKGYAVLYISTGIPVDLFFDKTSLEYVHTNLEKVIIKHNLPKDNIFLFGTMVSGHRALKYIEYVKKNNKTISSRIKGIVVSESPLDWVRMWYEGQKQVRDSLNQIKHFEGNLITQLFRENFGVTPEQNIRKYADFSTYSYFTTSTAKQRLFSKYAIRAYSFVPTNYWFSVNGNGVYDCNFPDMCGLINEQKLAGNKNAELIVFTNEQRETTNKMEVQSNTWNLIDKEELMNWIESKTR